MSNIDEDICVVNDQTPEYEPSSPPNNDEPEENDSYYSEEELTSAELEKLNMERAEKQGYLRDHIVSQGYKPDEFQNYIKSLKEYGDDIDEWTITELKDIVEEFKNTHEVVVKKQVINVQEQVEAANEVENQVEVDSNILTDNNNITDDNEWSDSYQETPKIDNTLNLNYFNNKEDLFADFNIESMGIFMTRDAVKEQKMYTKQTSGVGAGATDFEFDDEFQEAPVMFKRRQKKVIKD